MAGTARKYQRERGKVRPHVRTDKYPVNARLNVRVIALSSLHPNADRYTMNTIRTPPSVFPDKGEQESCTTSFDRPNYNISVR